MGAFMVKRLGTSWGTTGILLRGVAIQMCGLIVLIGPVLWGLLQPWIINLGMVLFVTGLGLVLPTATAAAMTARSSNAGQTAATLGLLQMGLGAAGNVMVNLALDASPRLGMQTVMAGFTLSAALMVWRLRVFK
jgi:hypothetical protein